MPQHDLATFLANNIQRDDLLSSMANGAPIRIRNVHGFGGEIRDGAMANVISGIVNHIEHEDGSGCSFNVTVGTNRIHITTSDKPSVFGLNHAHLRTEVPFTSEPPSWNELRNSFLEGKPIIGRFVVREQSLVLAGIIKSIERTDESGTFNVRIGDTLAQIQIRD